MLPCVPPPYTVPLVLWTVVCAGLSPWVHTCFSLLPWLTFFDPDDGCSSFFRNVDILPDYAASLHFSPLREPGSFCRILGSDSGGYEEFSIFWDITPGSQQKDNQPMFRRNTSPSSSGSKNKPWKKTPACRLCLPPASCWLILRPWRWTPYGPPKRLFTFNADYSVCHHVFSDS
jgi:hypothetical protein